MDTIKAKATAFAQSYTDAMALSLEPNPDIAACANVLVAHYSPNFTTFALGFPPLKLRDAYPESDASLAGQEKDAHAVLAAMVEGHLAKFEKAWFGWRVKMVKFDVRVYSAGSGIQALTSPPTSGAG
jgi:hypothetical protein